MPFYVSPEQAMKDKADYARKGIARGRANWYALVHGSTTTESNKPYEVELVVAEVGDAQDADQMYRITFDGSVADEHGFVAMGGQAEQVAGVLKERYAAGMSIDAALGAAIAALSGQGNGDRGEINASQLEVAVLVRGRIHRTFRRIRGARLEELLSQARSGGGKAAAGKDTESKGG